MKGLLIFIPIALVLFLSRAFGYAIVDNSSTRDTIAIPLVVLDSAGNAVDLASGDSMYIVTFYPGGGVAYRDSMAYDNSKIKHYDWEDFNGGRNYVYTEQISVLDGSSPVNGVYTYILTVDDNTSADLTTTVMGHFQVVSSTLESSLDSAAKCLKPTIDGRTLDVTANGEAGIDLDNTSGAFDLAEFANGCLNVDKIQDNTFTSGKFQHNFFSRLMDSLVNVLAADTGNGSYWGQLLRENRDILDSLYALLDSIQLKFAGRAAFDWNSNPVVIDPDNSTNRIYADTIANRVLEDSASYQGQGGSSDSTSIARWVWNTPQANHTVGGTFGKYLDSEISGVGSGSGLYSCGMIVIDSSAGGVVPGVNIAVRNIDQSALIAQGTTNSLGFAGFNLDADSFLVTSFAPGYIFNDFDSLIVSGPVADTAYGYQFDPGEPSIPGLCRLYGYVYDITGNPEADASITAWLPAGAAKAGVAVVSPFKVETSSNQIGYFYLDLIPSSQLIPDTTRYEITVIHSDGTILRERVIVPDQPNWRLNW